MPVSKNNYILNLDNKAVLDDGKQVGVILVARGGNQRGHGKRVCR